MRILNSEKTRKTTLRKINSIKKKEEMKEERNK